MKNTYITIIPMQMDDFEKKDFRSSDGCEIKYNGKPRYFPISAVIDQIKDLDPDIETDVIAVRFKTHLSDEYLDMLKDEINSLGLKDVNIIEITVPENQEYQNLIDVFMNVLKQIDDDTDVYACITFGSKIMSLIIAYLLDSLAYLRKNAKVQGVYYMELKRQKKVVIDKILYNVTDLVYLNKTVKNISNMRLSDPQAFLEKLLKGE